MKSGPNINDPDNLIKGILKGDITALSRAITLAESEDQEKQSIAEKILGGLMHKTGNSFRLGVTGAPGAGKSTFINAFGKFALDKGHKLAVLAIDPSSEISKGSILGDKTRMEELSVEPGVFIRPSPSGSAQGGVARRTYQAMLLCEAAGFDFIIIETVGVGQSETAVNRLCDFFLLLTVAGAGDELQGIKRGIMEMSDGIIVTKADGDNISKAALAAKEYARALHLLQPPPRGWKPEVMSCSGTTGKGIPEFYNLILKFRQFAAQNPFFTEQRKSQSYQVFLAALEDGLKSRFYSHPYVQSLLKDLEKKGVAQPFTLASRVIDELMHFGKE